MTTLLSQAQKTVSDLYLLMAALEDKHRQLYVCDGYKYFKRCKAVGETQLEEWQRWVLAARAARRAVEAAKDVVRAIADADCQFRQN